MASGGLKVFTAGVTAASTGLAALGGAAIKAYADYEQLVGGVETLFGTGGMNTIGEYAQSVGKSFSEVREEFESLKQAEALVMENANNAYKTAGLSANAYMETVTSFAASLKQSCETELEAAEIADQAIIDMSDNANKMGTSMEAIQNAYQGFAKQNYTMLDNLKLGYGGTKTEMERLLADASELSGIEYNIDNLSDVYSAIHVIQEEMGITGTTAKEASTTIAGSASAMKSAWSNLMVGIADDSQDFDTLIDNFVESVATFAENIIPRVGTALEGIGQLIAELLPVVMDKIPTIITEVLPDLLSSGVQVVTSIGNGIMQALPLIGEMAYDMIMQFLTSITENAGQMASGGSSMLLELVTGIAQALPSLLTAGIQAVVSLAMALTQPDTLTNIISAGINLLLGLVTGILQALPELIGSAPILMGRMAAALIANIPQLLAAAVRIMSDLATYLVMSVAHLLTAVPKLFISFVDSFKSMDWASIGSNIIDGIWNGIQAGWQWLIDSVSNLATSLFNSAKEALDIHSPSRKFKYLGEMCVAGFDEGIEDLMSADSMAKNINASISTMRMNLSNNASGPSVGGMGSFNQTINVNQPISTPDELARAIRVESRYGLMKGVALG